MLRSSDTETEILLGNKQVLGIFLLAAILIGVAFGGGFILGRGAADKKTASTATPEASAKDTAQAKDTAANPTGGETRTVSPSDSSAVDDGSAAAINAAQRASDAPPLGSRKAKPPARAEAPVPEIASPVTIPVGFQPQSGQEFLQVAAVPRSDAAGIADVLRKKGFHAHTVPVPGSTKLYRVIVGPLRDVGDLSSTRDRLRRTGFGKVIVQKY